jgi:hypothetical protein
MPPRDIESELSYAYLHAVASSAGVACQVTTRSHDNLGIDAALSLSRDFGADAPLTDVTLHIQLKATVKPPSRQAGRLSYWLDDLGEYNRLRQSTAVPPRLLAVLFLPADPAEWLSHSTEALALRQCAYWLSLLGAPPTTNQAGQTVYFPEQQVISPEGLVALFSRVAHMQELRYAV